MELIICGVETEVCFGVSDERVERSVVQRPAQCIWNEPDKQLDGAN